tara:strand:- start:965 stop:2086 length:1122 start_codon:yes stop_codon:yes gene_type:complete
MVLVNFIFKLKSTGKLAQEVKVLHFDHNLRENSHMEARFVKSVCAGFGFEMFSEIWKHDEGSSVSSNLESKARKARHSFFNSKIDDNSILLLAHHLDDDIEWNLLSRFKSSNVGRSSYINQWDNRIFRPFLETPKSTLIKISSHYNIPFVEDSSNLDTRFERNFLRHKILPLVDSRFKNFREHFLFQKYQLISNISEKSISDSVNITQGFISLNLNLHINKQENSKAIFYSVVYKTILKCFEHFDLGTERGKVSRQVLRIIQAVSNNSKGPILLSGSLYAFIDYGFVHFSPKQKLNLDLGTSMPIELSELSKNFYPFFFYDGDFENTSCKGFKFDFESQSLKSISIGYINKHFKKLKKHNPGLSLRLIKVKSI